MIINDYPLVAIISMGHTGSRLLSQILQANGIFMGRRTCVPGEDSKIGITNDMVFEQAAIKYHLGYNKNPLVDLLKEKLENFEEDVFLKTRLTFDVKERIKNIVFGKSTYFKHRPKNLNGLAVKNAIASTMYCWALQDLAVKLGKVDNLYFIHLTRNLNDWLDSGIKKGTKGIKRPIFLPYANNFLNDYNKYLWFGSMDDNLEIGNITYNLKDFGLDKMEEYRIDIESLLWANANYRSWQLKERNAKYLQIKYEDILLNPERIKKDLSEFFNRDIRVTSVPIDKSRVKRVVPVKESSPFVLEVQNILGYN